MRKNKEPASVASELIAELSLKQALEFMERFQRHGGSVEAVQKLLGNNSLMEQFVEEGLKLPGFRLIHTVFHSQADVLRSFKARCVEKGVEFTKFKWTTSETAPDFTDDDEEVAVVLDATLGTLEETFKFSWEWTVDGQRGRARGAIRSDSKSLRLYSDNRFDEAEGDGPGFTPWTLAWRRIKLDTNVNRGKLGRPHCDLESAPCCSLLFMAAQHPERMRASDNEKRFGFRLPSLKCRKDADVPDVMAWKFVPILSFNRLYGVVNLYYDFYVRGWEDYLAEPVLWKETI